MAGDRTRAVNGRSSVYLGNDGWWHGRVSMGVRDDGKPDRRHVRGKTQKDVTAKVKNLEHERAAGTVSRPGQRWTVAGWLEHWVENIISASVRQSILTGYRTAVYRRPRQGSGAIVSLGSKQSMWNGCTRRWRRPGRSQGPCTRLIERYAQR